MDSQIKYNIAVGVALSIPIALQISTYMARKGRVDMMSKNKYIIGSGVLLSGIYGFVRMYMFNREMDKKYTPIWLKSTGKLDK